MKILLAENDPVVGELLVTLLAGHEVTRAADGLGAVSLLRDAGPWEALVLDMVLPGLSGFEVLERGPLPPKVVVTTALDETDLRGLAEKHPAVTLLRKPFALEELRAALGETTAGQ